MVTVRQYRLLEEGEEVGHTILELENAHVVRPMCSPFNSPVWAVKKPHRTWRMTVDHKELNKVGPPLHAAVPSISDLVVA